MYNVLSHNYVSNHREELISIQRVDKFDYFIVTHPHQNKLWLLSLVYSIIQEKHNEKAFHISYKLQFLGS